VPNRKDEEKWPFWAQFTLALVALLFGLLLTVVLPLFGAIYVGRIGGDAVGPGIWAPLIATLLGLTTLTVSGIFVFMTFRIDRGTRLRATTVAEDTAREFLKNDKEISELRSGVQKSAKVTTQFAVQLRCELNKTKVKTEAHIESKLEEVNEHATDAEARIRSQIGDVERKANNFLAHCKSHVQSAVDDRVTPQLVESILDDLLNTDAYKSLAVETVRRFASDADPREAQNFVRDLIGGLRTVQAEMKRKESAHSGWRGFLRRFRSDKR